MFQKVWQEEIFLFRMVPWQMVDSIYSATGPLADAVLLSWSMLNTVCAHATQQETYGNTFQLPFLTCWEIVKRKLLHLPCLPCELVVSFAAIACGPTLFRDKHFKPNIEQWFHTPMFWNSYCVLLTHVFLFLSCNGGPLWCYWQAYIPSCLLVIFFVLFKSEAILAYT